MIRFQILLLFYLSIPSVTGVNGNCFSISAPLVSSSFEFVSSIFFFFFLPFLAVSRVYPLEPQFPSVQLPLNDPSSPSRSSPQSAHRIISHPSVIRNLFLSLQPSSRSPTFTKHQNTPLAVCVSSHSLPASYRLMTRLRDNCNIAPRFLFHASR